MTTHALKPVQAARRHLYWPLRTVWKGHTQILMARTPGPKNHALKFRVATSFYLFGFACWLYSVHIWYNHCLVFWCLRIARFNAKSIIELSHFRISKMQKIDFYLTDTNVLKFECSKLSKFLLFWMQAFSLIFYSPAFHSANYFCRTAGKHLPRKHGWNERFSSSCVKNRKWPPWRCGFQNHTTARMEG